MTDQTPNTEDVRSTYIDYWVACAEQDGREGSRFDAWLAARDRAVKAEALREAARAIDGVDARERALVDADGAVEVLEARADRDQETP